MTEGGLDAILAIQLLVAWAGEGRCEPKRLGWWDTDLIDSAGGGDLLRRLAPHTHAWAALETVREAARRVDAAGRGKLGDPDRLRTVFFLGFELDERLTPNDIQRVGLSATVGNPDYILGWLKGSSRRAGAVNSDDFTQLAWTRTDGAACFSLPASDSSSSPESPSGRSTCWRLSAMDPW